MYERSGARPAAGAFMGEDDARDFDRGAAGIHFQDRTAAAVTMKGDTPGFHGFQGDALGKDDFAFVGARADFHGLTWFAS